MTNDNSTNNNDTKKDDSATADDFKLGVEIGKSEVVKEEDKEESK